MTTREVINKLALELAFETGNMEDVRNYKKYLRMALVVGMEHFVNTKEEIVAMDFEGVERGRYASIQEAARKLSLDASAICKVVNRKIHSHGGLLFIRSKEQELINKERSEVLIPVNDRAFSGFKEHGIG